MPTFSSDLPPNRRHMGFDIVRTPADKALTAIVTSENLLVTNTHYWGGRTVPCEMPDCEPCNASIPYRTHVYVSAFTAFDHLHVIFECTAHAAKAFEEYRNANGTLRGCYFSAARPKRTKNGRVVITTKPADLAKIAIPSSPNLILALSIIWRLPMPALRELYAADGRSTIRTDPTRTAVMRQQPDNQPDPPTIGEIIGDGNGDKPTLRVLQ